MVELNYCSVCGEELVDDAKYCHSCGKELSKLGQDTKDNEEAEQSSSEGAFQYIDDTTMGDIDLWNSSEGNGEMKEMMEDRIAQVVDEEELTIDDIRAEDIFHYFIVDKIFERSARIKYQERFEG